MTEKELIKSLSALKNVTANPSWIQKNRELLSYQIFNGAEQTFVTLGFFDRLSLISKRVLQPTPIAALIALFFMVSGLVGLHASQISVPGDTLYVAKQISEKLQLTTTFDETAKAKLNLEFASQRATELEKVIEANNKDPRIQELAANFQKEIDSARTRLDKIESGKIKQAVATAATKQKLSLPKGTNNETQMFSAGSSKDQKGIQISTPDTRKALEEAQKLFNNKDYSGAVNILGEISKQLY